MTNKISKIFDVSLSMSSKIIINEWLIDEFGSTYSANKALNNYNDIKDFILDMIEQSGNDNIIKEIDPTLYEGFKIYFSDKK